MAVANVTPYVWWNPSIQSVSALNPATPVIIGVADVRQKGHPLSEAKEPAQLMEEAIRAAALDSGVAEQVLQQVDSVSVVASWTWEYKDLPLQLSKAIGLNPDTMARREISPHSGNHAGRLLDEACKYISEGRVKMAVVTGGEALNSLGMFAAKGERPPWTPAENIVTGKVGSVLPEESLHTRHGAFAPVQLYPFYENALRASRSQTYAENELESAELYAEFARNASKLPAAWNYGSVKTREEIMWNDKNRMICYPYPLLQNAFNTVNLAGCLILTSLSHALSLGISPSRLAYPLGGAGTSDSTDYLDRPAYDVSPSINNSLDVAMKLSNVKMAEIDALDIYSCFPVVPKLACLHLGVDIVKPKIPISICGGLTSFGGAGNNYSMHPMIEMVRRIRSGLTKTGLVLANGGYVSYHHVVILSSKPNGLVYPTATFLPKQQHLPEPPKVIEFVGEKPQEVVIETYTVEYSRDNKPSKSIFILRFNTPGRERTLANGRDVGVTDAVIRAHKAGVEVVGMRGWVVGKGKRNMFYFGEGAKM